MRVQQMNHVNLIGQMCSDPTIIHFEDGRRMAKFSMSTKETYLDKDGSTKNNTNWHQITAWGRWVPVLEELGSKGLSLAIEGRLKSHFYKMNGRNKSFTEIEVNDMVIL
ncbi:MAG: single-stranded DNA-binding protein [Brumimicrobium sp.]|nr:single-stranded DNA-binding protein [Brumimicrobium sp.]MCO5267482.1 single-stranded DNA-binding protein [Brumimicrobium sp.]